MDIGTLVFIAALFTIVKTWKQTKCSSADKWIKKLWHIYNGIPLNHKNEWSDAIYSNMDGPRDYPTKWSQLDRERQIPYDITSMWDLEYDTNELIYETETDSQI